MMAHVAEAGEASGRVLLLIEEGIAPIEAAARSACRFAAAFNAEVESIAVNLDFAERAGGVNSSALVAQSQARPLVNGTLARVAAVQSLLNMRQIRVIERASWSFGVPCRHTSLAGDAIDRLSEVCVSRGPWNIVVLSAPTRASTASTIGAIFANVSGATGIVTGPSKLLAEGGPVVIVVEDAERLPAMLRAAGKLNNLCGRVHIVLAKDKRSDLAELENHVRLVIGKALAVDIVPAEPLLGLEGALDDTLRRLKPSFVVARFSGSLLPTPRSLARTITVTGAPFLLVR